MKVIDVLLAIDESFPFAHAFDGDKVGLLVGDAGAEVCGILVSLDPGLDAIARAQTIGANLIVSHHPIRFNSRGHYNISHVADTYPERILAQALSAKIAIIAAHTNVDVSSVARNYWGDKLSFQSLGPLPAFEAEFGIPCTKNELSASDPYGEMWQIPTPRSLSQLAAEVAGITECAVKVYGDPETLIASVATATGSGSGRIAEALVAGVDCIISGEFSYHAALAAVESGLTLIEIGHDISELPLVDMIADAIKVRTPIKDEEIHIDDRPQLWHSITSSGKVVED